MAIASDSFTGVDLSRLPAPSVIETLDFEVIRADNLAQLLELAPDYDIDNESDPVVKLIEAFAYRELIWRQRANDAAKAVMVAYAEDSDLDALAALFGVERAIITPANPETGAAAVLERDEDLRRRLVLAPEGYSVAGPEGAYIYHALAASADVLDASATSPSPGQVLVTILSRTGDGSAPAATLEAVTARLTNDAVRPLTDQVIVQSAQILPFAVEATLTFFAGPDRSVVLATAQSQLAALLANAKRLGRDVTRAALIAALCPAGVQNVALHSPPEDMPVTRLQAGHCTGVSVLDGGVAE